MYPVVDEDNCLFWNSFKSAAYRRTTSEFKDISIGRVPSIDKVTLKQEYMESLIAKYLNLLNIANFFVQDKTICVLH